jgi:putative membrane protein
MANNLRDKTFGGHMLLRSFNCTLAAAALVFAACGRKDNNYSADTRAPAAAPATSNTTPAALNTATASPGLSDANIFYILDQANAGDSSSGVVAVKKGTNSQVREFGRMMIRDHHMLRKQGQDLAKRLVIQPAVPANDSSLTKQNNTLAMLEGVAKGKDFDKAYIDNEVEVHRQVLQTAITAMNATQNSELKNLIQKAAPVIQAHLDKAQAIQKNLQR